MGRETKHWLALALSAALAVQLTACHTTPAPDPDPSPSPTQEVPSPTPTPVAKQAFSLPVEPEGTWNPYVGSRSTNMILASLLYDSLYGLDNSFEPYPVLAQGAAAEEDGLTWRVTLKSGVTFSNGTALDARTVCAALTAAKGEKSLYAARLEQVKTITAEGENTVVFQLNVPNRDLLALLDIPVALVEQEEVYGTGRYVLDGERLLARAGGWRGSLEIPREIKLTSISAADELIAAFDSGGLGLVASDPTGPDALGFSGSYQTWEYPTTTMLYLGFHRASGVCQNPEVRAALSRAVDRGELVKEVLKGHASIAALPAPPTAKRYDQTVAKTLGYDPLAAAEALDAMGYEVGEDGVRRSGKRTLALTLLVNSDNLFKEKLGAAIAADLEAVGFEVTVTALPWEEYKKALATGEFDLYLGETRLTGDLDLSAFFTAGSGLCYGGAPDKELAGALESARATGEWQEFYALYAQQPPFVTLCFKTGAVLTQWGQVSGLRPTQNDLFYQLENWTFDQ